MRMPKLLIGVIGSSSCSPETAETAMEVGREIARRGAVLVCGGLGGVMEAACRGAKEAGGTTVGILPGFDRGEANPYVDIPIVTGLSHARNAIVARTSDSVIAVAGGYGTLSELAFALQLGIPVIGLNTWNLDAPIIRAPSPSEAVSLALEQLGKPHAPR